MFPYISEVKSTPTPKKNEIMWHQYYFQACKIKNSNLYNMKTADPIMIKFVQGASRHHEWTFVGLI